ncbi:MAG: TRAP transporter small permease [Pseudomonadota bacterium]
MGALGRHLRKALDGLYFGSGLIAAAFMLMILVIITAQMVTRWSGIAFPGATDYAGYCMAAASFFAFAHALNAGSHIRVSLFLNQLGRMRLIGEAWCLAIGSALACYLAWYAAKAVYWSHLLGDISQGQDEMPLWIPQLAMAVGAIILAIALIDNLVTLLVTGRDNIEADAVESASD